VKLADAAEYYEFSCLNKSPTTQRCVTAHLFYFVQWDATRAAYCEKWLPLQCYGMSTHTQ
jgi:hypothetical protein